VFVDQPCALAPSVVSDNRLGAMLLTDSLLSSILIDSSFPRKRLYFLGGNSALYASSQRILGFTDALNERGYHVDPAQIIACGYDKETARQNLQTLYEQLGGLPSGLLINSLDCLEGSLAFLGTLPEEEILNCTIGCYDYDPFGTLLRIPMNMIRQRSSELIRKAYSYIDDGVREPILSLVEPELLLAPGR
jgi:LacI family fructose operon transcriptional repressor